MNLDTANRLLDRVKSYWGAIPEAVQDDWLDTLETLDEGTAGTTLQRLIASHPDRTPTIAQLLATYRSLDTASRHHPTDCPICNGDGWRHQHKPDCPDPDREDCGHNCPVRPCDCQNSDPHRQAFKAYQAGQRPRLHPVGTRPPRSARTQPAHNERDAS